MVLRDKIYNTIKERITSGKYAPGQPLDEKQIIEELRTSRTPFREAINALSEEGLVEVYPYRGIFVRDLSVKDIADGFDIRLLLEPKVLELASYRIHNAFADIYQGRYLAGIAAGMKINEMIERIEHIDKTNYVALLNEDGYFHETLISYIDNQQLIKIMKNLYAYNLFQVALFDDLGNNCVSGERLAGAVQSLEEHLDILREMKHHNTASAVEKMRFHIEQARKRTLQ